MKKFMQKYGAMVSCWLFAAALVLFGFAFATIPGKSHAADEIPVVGKWVPVTWEGLPDDNIQSGKYIWQWNGHTYYSYSSNQYELTGEKTWTPVTFTGLSSFSGNYVWHSNKHTYYSNGFNQYELTEERTWSPITISGWSWTYGDDVWHWNGHTYYANASSSSYKELTEEQTWERVSFTGLSSFYGKYVWNWDKHCYFNDLELVEERTWKVATFSGVTPSGIYVWHWDEHTYYSINSHQYELIAERTWVPVTWMGLTDPGGEYIWNDGEHLYYSNGAKQYELMDITLEDFVEDVTVDYDGTNQIDTIKAQSWFDADTMAITEAEIKNAGTYTVHITKGEEVAEITLTINAASVRANLINGGWTYGDTPVNTAINFTGLIDGDTLGDDDMALSYTDRNGEPVTFTNHTPAGQYTATLTLKDTVTNYVLITDNHTNTITFNINPKPISATFGSAGGVKGGSLKLPNVTLNGVLDGDTVQFNETYFDSASHEILKSSINTNEIGEYKLAVTLKDTETNYTLTAHECNFAVIDAFAFDFTANYTGDDQTVAEINPAWYDDDYTITCDETICDVKDYAIHVENGIYALDVTLTMLPAPLTVQFAAGGWIYGDAINLPTVTFNGLKNADTVTYDVACAKDDEPVTLTNRTPAGEYTMTVALKDTVENYVLTGETSTTFTITPRQLMVTIKDGGWVEGQPALLPEVWIVGAVDGDEITQQITYIDADEQVVTDIENAAAGTYIMKVKIIVNQNYTLADGDTFIKPFKVAAAPVEPEQPTEDSTEQTGNPNDQINGNEQFANQPEANNSPVLPIVAGVAGSAVIILAIGATVATVVSRRKN